MVAGVTKWEETLWEHGEDRADYENPAAHPTAS